jgi:RNA polymerase sigma factor (sigma-70 family)
VINNSEHIGLIYKISYDLIRENDLCRRVIGNTPDEYLGIGYLALQTAKKNYDPNFNVRFSTYATEVIKDQIIKHARHNSTLIKVASAYRYQAWRVSNGKDQTRGNQKTVNSALRVLNGKMAPLALLAGAIGEETGEDLWIKKEQVSKLMMNLDERTRHIICMRYGICGHQPATLEEVGSRLTPKLSRERVRQIEKKGLRRLETML